MHHRCPNALRTSTDILHLSDPARPLFGPQPSSPPPALALPLPVREPGLEGWKEKVESYDISDSSGGPGTAWPYVRGALRVCGVRCVCVSLCVVSVAFVRVSRWFVTVLLVR